MQWIGTKPMTSKEIEEYNKKASCGDALHKVVE